MLGETDYDNLIDKPVEAWPNNGLPERGILRRDTAFSSGLKIESFDRLGASWATWYSVNELAFDELRRDELLAWHRADPFNFLMAGIAWAASNQPKE